MSTLVEASTAMRHVLAFSGGVGGAKLALGLANILPPDRLTIACNTGDDFTHLGLRICPDLDTVMYTLANRSNPEQGWGLRNESWHVMEALADIGGDTWFRLGDRDLATHLLRTQLHAQGHTLTQITDRLCTAMSIAPRILPMSDDPVSTTVLTDNGPLSFQHYFVREQCKPRVTGFHYDGADSASIQTEVRALLASDRLDAIILCPSNPFVSVAPILALPGMREALAQCRAPVIAVSPIVGGEALKGPAAKMMSELALDISPAGIAGYYGDVIDGLVFDHVDASYANAVARSGVQALSAQTVMTTLADRKALAQTCLQFAARIAGRT